MKSWIRKIVLEGENDIVQKSNSKPSLAEEATAAAKAAAAAAADVAKTSQEILTSKIEGGIRMEFSLFYSVKFHPSTWIFFTSGFFVDG